MHHITLQQPQQSLKQSQRPELQAFFPLHVTGIGTPDCEKSSRGDDAEEANEAEEAVTGIAISPVDRFEDGTGGAAPTSESMSCMRW
jgi:hypothetical protein